MGNAKLFQSDPRDYALMLVEEGIVSDETMLITLLRYMSHDDVREALDANEISPRFFDDDDEDEDD